MRESAAWRYVDSHCPSHVHIERVEVKHPPGLADCFWHDKDAGVSGWLELKYTTDQDREFRAGRIPKLRKEQPLWLNRWQRAGVPTGILMRVGESFPTWMLWIPTGEPEWANVVRSTEAHEIVTETWEGLLDLIGVFDLLVASRKLW